MTTSLLGQIIQWGSGVDYELDFWRNWLRESGGAWPHDFTLRLDPNVPLDPALAEGLREGGVVVDVGAGLLSALGTKVKGKTIRVIACDPLMDCYLRILGEYNIKPRTEVLTAFAEDLSSSFGTNSVDLVHCTNALDHAFDPLRGLEEMLEIVKPAGRVYLGHHRNEAETENYAGFHQWNFDKNGDDFVMWNKSESISIRQAIGKFASVDVDLANEGGAVTLWLRKKTETADELSAMINARRRARLRDALLVLRDVTRDRANYDAARRSMESQNTCLQKDSMAQLSRSIELEERCASAESELASARAQLSNVEARLSAVLGSRSWKLTAPLRRLASEVAGKDQSGRPFVPGD